MKSLLSNEYAHNERISAQAYKNHENKTDSIFWSSYMKKRDSDLNIESSLL